MEFGSAFLYYNPQWGYIIASDTTIADSIMRVTIEPVNTEKANITAEQLGKAIFAGLEKSRTALPVEREEIKNFKFWQISGIKSFAAFSKKFRCVEVIEQEDAYKLARLKRDSDGSFSWIKNDLETVLPLDSSEEYMGQLLYNLLDIEEINHEVKKDLAWFQSVNENKVIFNRPSDDFIDIDDGHTDAYQIYINQNDDKSYIAFLINNGYMEINSQGIERRWKQIYGYLEDYNFEESKDGLLKIIVSAKTARSYIKSYFFQDGEDLLEVLTEVSTNISEDKQLNLMGEMKRTIDSIKIVQADK